jgi:lactoylglutathione lyase
VAVESVGYVILYVRDLDASAAFYRDVVGLPFKFRDAGYAELATGETRFGLLERTRASDLIQREPTEGGPAGEVLFPVDDVDAEAERLRALGVELLSGPVDRPWGHWTLHLLDPDGFVVELAQKIPRLADREIGTRPVTSSST